MSPQMPRVPEPEIMDEVQGAEAYALSDFSDVNQHFVDTLLTAAGRIEKARVVDLGTGPADIPIRLVRSRPDWRVVAIDASAAMLEHACKAVDHAGFGNSGLVSEFGFRPSELSTLWTCDPP